ncbi:MAG: 4Fe-4S dicluster domain-containing protein [Chloroflexi bacterium]|nr:4Fe-4S dicluster domain-containing protein [Chloroflexota bacterium]
MTVQRPSNDESLKQTVAENEKKFQLSRRNLLKLMGATAVAGAAIPLIPNAVANAVGAISGSPEADSITQAENSVSERVRRWMMIIDQRYCDGCQSQGTAPQCTQACNDGHYVPEPMEWIEVYEHELSPEKEAYAGQQPSMPFEGTQFTPTMCQQCQNAPCVNVCPVGATWTTPEGITLIDQDRCIGCRMCMAACPYERRFFTWGEPSIPPAAHHVTHSSEHQIPLKKGVVAKCDFCPEMAREGKLPFCAQACPQNAIYYGDFEEDLASNGEDIVSISEFLAANSATRLKEDLGTRPRVYYIPGHGELAGRDPKTPGRMPVTWLGDENPATKTWARDGR